jgi:hypothetical protein
LFPLKNPTGGRPYPFPNDNFATDIHEDRNMRAMHRMLLASAFSFIAASKPRQRVQSCRFGRRTKSNSMMRLDIVIVLSVKSHSISFCIVSQVAQAKTIRTQDVTRPQVQFGFVTL